MDLAAVVLSDLGALKPAHVAQDIRRHGGQPRHSKRQLSGRRKRFSYDLTFHAPIYSVTISARFSMGKHPILTIVLLGLMMLLYARSASSADDALPAEVSKLVDRREECHHWAGEEPYNKTRSRQIDKAMNSLKCDSIEKEVQDMRAKHSGNAAVQAALPDIIE